MAYIDVELEDSVHITVREFFRNMDDQEKEEMRSLLKMESSLETEDFDQKVKKLIGNRWRLTLEDEETVLKIAEKIVC